MENHTQDNQSGKLELNIRRYRNRKHYVISASPKLWKLKSRYVNIEDLARLMREHENLELNVIQFSTGEDITMRTLKTIVESMPSTRYTKEQLTRLIRTGTSDAERELDALSIA